VSAKRLQLAEMAVVRGTTRHRLADMGRNGEAAEQARFQDPPVPGPAPSAGWRRPAYFGTLFGKLRANIVRPSRLLGIFASLVGSQLGGALLGLVFWIFAARALTPEQVGVGAALVAAMALLSMFGDLGIGTLLLERFKVVPVPERRALLSTGLSIAVAGGVLFALVWLGLSTLVHLPGVLGSLSLSTALLLVAATGLAATCSARDQAVIGMGASRVQLRRNLLASVIRIAVLLGAVALDMRSGQVIVIAWTVGLVGSLLATPLPRHLSPRTQTTIKQRWCLVRDHWTAALGHHTLTLAMVASGLVLPVAVASIMSATATAHFTQARLLADTALALPYYLTLALFATVATADGFRRKAPRTLIMGMALALSTIAVAALFGRVLLSTFGHSYSQESMPLLLLILVTGPALVIKDHFAVLRRFQGKRTQGALTVGLWATAEVVGAVVGGLAGGIRMLCLGWVAMSAVCALIALPVLVRAIRREPTGANTRYEGLPAVSAVGSTPGSN
jgi:O-antigen/teichoic acid export membrane protein